MAEEPVKDDKAAEPDEDENKQLRTFVKWYNEWEDNTEESRKLSVRDDEYYHGNQLTQEEKQDLKDRGQPEIIKNRVAKKINFLEGNEIANRSDPKALPRTQQHESDVQAITDALRYVADKEDFDQIASMVWSDMLRPGSGGAIVEHEETEGPKGKKLFDIKIRQFDWDRLWYDIRSRKKDYSDARYMGITTWWHLEEAIGDYAARPHVVANFEEILKQGVVDSRATSETMEDVPRWALRSSAGDRVRVNEIYYKDLHPKTRKMVWFTAHYTEAGLLVKPRPTGHKDDKGRDINPMVATTAYVTRDGVRYGPIRNMIGSQDEINKLSSKSVHQAVMERMTVEEGVIKDIEEAREERAKPDGLVEVQRNALVEGRLQYDKGMTEAQFFQQAADRANAYIDSIGPEIPAIGSVGAGSSGRALQQRQMIGALEIATLLDSLRRFRRAIYERVWWKIKALWTEETWLRVRDDPEGKGYKFVGLNRKLTKGERFQELIGLKVPPESALRAIGVDPGIIQEIQQRLQQAVQAGQVDPQQAPDLGRKALLESPPMKEAFTAADVAAINVDIIIEESPDVAIVQQEELQELRETLQSYMASGQADPSVSRELVKLIIKAGQLRTKKQLLEMMEKPPDPKQVEIQQQQQQTQMAALQAQVQVLMSQAALNQAKAAQAGADAQLLKPAEAELKEAQTVEAMASAGEKTGQPVG